MADELKLVLPPPGLAEVRADGDLVGRIVRQHLDRAEAALVRVGPLGTFRNWYSGAALEQAWLNIHRAGEALLMIESPGSLITELVQADGAFRATIEPSDPRYATLACMLSEVSHKLVKDPQTHELTAILRGKLKAVRSVANVASDTAHETVRRWRNLLLVGGCALAVFSIAVTIAHVAVPNFFSLVPSGISAKGDAIEPWEVVLLGSLGGALAAVLALNRFSGFTDPAGLPVVQALLRIPTAAVTSLIGVLLMQTAALDVLKPQNGATVLAYAFLFGYAQEPLLRAIDRRAGMVLDPARNKDEPAKIIPPAAAPPTGKPPSQSPTGEEGGPPAGGGPTGGRPSAAPPASTPTPGAPPPGSPPSSAPPSDAAPSVK
ncbi:MAG: hypothetical protein M3Y17_04605 [Actinomycetota bacterium]|nr:hypothetical protein [Actinomycetota bacterium]